jgi:hypothetical protein
MSRVEEPSYTVIESHGRIDVRQYGPMIVAETQATGGQKDAISQGFRSLAAYIFGGNASAQKIAMTAPVIQQALGNPHGSAKAEHAVRRESWRIRFVTPQAHALEALPAPLDPAAKLVRLAARRYVAIRFSGSGTEGDIRQHHDILRNHVLKQGLDATGEPVLAFYNPPWTLPLLRRNEIWLELAG